MQVHLDTLASMTGAGQPNPNSNGIIHDQENVASKALHTRTPSFLDMQG